MTYTRAIDVHSRPYTIDLRTTRSAFKPDGCRMPTAGATMKQTITAAQHSETTTSAPPVSRNCATSGIGTSATGASSHRILRRVRASDDRYRSTRSTPPASTTADVEASSSDPTTRGSKPTKDTLNGFAIGSAPSTSAGVTTVGLQVSSTTGSTRMSQVSPSVTRSE